mgnify:CR=1 FL=1
MYLISSTFPFLILYQESVLYYKITINACHLYKEIAYGSIMGLVKKMKKEIHVSLNYVSFQLLLAAMPCFVQLEEMGNSPCVMNYT